MLDERFAASPTTSSGTADNLVNIIDISKEPTRGPCSWEVVVHPETGEKLGGWAASFFADCLASLKSRGIVSSKYF